MQEKQLIPAIDFENTELAFQAKSNARLRRTYWLFRLIDNPFITKWGSKLLQLALRWRLPVQGLIKHTVFELFVSGEKLKETGETASTLAEYGVYSVLDYSVEGERSEQGFESTKQEMLATLRFASQHAPIVFSACKLTGLASFELMEKIQSGQELTKGEKEAQGKVWLRMDELAQAAHLYGTPLFIDAEETWIQDFIDQVAEALMEKYNQEKPVIWTTVQFYRHDRLSYLQGLIDRSRERGYVLGVKLVRGAYLEKEHARALELGYPTPIQPSKQATDRDYDAGLALCMQHLDHVALCAGTHNEQSSLYLTQLMAEQALPPNHPHVWFCQLLGMSDHISFNLAHQGYRCAKYLPYGPVRAVIPYLIRRANENTSIAGQSGREVTLLRKELKRRKDKEKSS
ncbi:MAG: proline dehydrogenase family protein [Bacteroidota bacterium]